MRIGEPESLFGLTKCHVFDSKHGMCLALSSRDMQEHYYDMKYVVDMPITSLGAIKHTQNYFNKYPHLIPHIDSLREMHVNHLTKRNEHLTDIYNVALDIIKVNVNE